MNFSRLETCVMRDEGFRARPYLDTQNIPTIGYGAVNVLGKPVTIHDPAITVQQARTLLRASLYGALIDAQVLFRRFDEMNAVRQECLVNFVFNLGRYRANRFKKLIQAAEDLDYEEMAEQMRQSDWYYQVKSRAVRLINQMRTGES